MADDSQQKYIETGSDVWERRMVHRFRALHDEATMAENVYRAENEMNLDQQLMIIMKWHTGSAHCVKGH